LKGFQERSSYRTYLVFQGGNFGFSAAASSDFAEPPKCAIETSRIEQTKESLQEHTMNEHVTLGLLTFNPEVDLMMQLGYGAPQHAKNLFGGEVGT
jgi:hypothetical protein